MKYVSGFCIVKRGRRHDTGTNHLRIGCIADCWDGDIRIGTGSDMEEDEMTKRDMQNWGMGSAFVVFWLATAASVIVYGLELMK